MKKYVIILMLVIGLVIGCTDGGNDSYTPAIIDNPDVDIDNNTTTQTDAETVSMRFSVVVPNITPSSEFICIDFNDVKSPIKMNLAEAKRWQVDLNESDIDSVQYKYCRNCECEAADEEFENSQTKWREFSFVSNTIKDDVVFKWRWLNEDLLSFDLNTSGYLQTKPTINKAEFISGVMLIDWWKADWMDAVSSSMQKIKTDTSSQWVQYTPIPEMTQIYPTPIISKNVNNGTSDEDLIQIIKSAHDNGLKVFLNPSLWSFEVDNSPEDHNQTWWNAFAEQWRPIILDYATIARDNNVEMLEFKMWLDIDRMNDSEKAKMNDLASTLLADVRNIYSGKIAVQSICYDVDRPVLDVHYNSDYLAMNIWSYYPWHLGDTKDDNVTQINAILNSRLDECKAYDDNKSLSKPVIIEQLSSASYDGALIGANPDEETIDSFHENNSSWSLDLQEQADMYEASLYAISQRDWIVGNFAFVYFYWDSIGKDINIREKPAEKVVSKWYDWFNN